MVKPVLPLQGAQVRSPVRELRSRMLCGQQVKIKKKKDELASCILFHIETSVSYLKKIHESYHSLYFLFFGQFSYFIRGS